MLALVIVIPALLVIIVQDLRIAQVDIPQPFKVQLGHDRPVETRISDDQRSPGVSIPVKYIYKCRQELFIQNIFYPV